MQEALLIVVAYLLGTLPSATWIARANGVDITKVGSGNPGASNVTRVLGWRKGVWVYVIDALKAALATGVGLWFDGRPLAYWCGAAAIVGHMFPIFRRSGRRFFGGKGVACASGVLAVLHPVLALAALPLWWVITKITGKAAIGSIVTMCLVPVGLALLGRPAWEYAAVSAISALILVKHGSNISRLVRRKEPSLRGAAH